MGDLHHEKIVARMARIDALPPAIRELIHEEGLSIVQSFLDVGVKKPEHIRHLIMRVRSGSVDIGTGAGGFGWTQNGRQMVVVPLEPTPAMINASMETVSAHDVECTKFEKHKRRLRAAIKAGMSRYA